MENLYFEGDSAFEGSMQNINMCLESAIITYTEELFDKHYVTEAVKKTLWTHLKEFFTKIILSFKLFIDDLKIKIEYTVAEKQIRDKLDALHHEFKTKENAGMRTVEMVDYWKMKKIYKSYHSELIGYAKKFSKVKYTKTWQIEDDLNDFNKLVEKCNNELEKLATKKIKVPVKKALVFVEDEIRGKSEIIESIQESRRDFSEVEQLAMSLQTRMNILGADVLPKHVGFIQRIINSISAFIRRWTVKIIMGIVFLFA